MSMSSRYRPARPSRPGHLPDVDPLAARPDVPDANTRALLHAQQQMLDRQHAHEITMRGRTARMALLIIGAVCIFLGLGNLLLLILGAVFLLIYAIATVASFFGRG